MCVVQGPCASNQLHDFPICVWLAQHSFDSRSSATRISGPGGDSCGVHGPCARESPRFAAPSLLFLHLQEREYKARGKLKIRYLSILLRIPLAILRWPAAPSLRPCGSVRSGRVARASGTTSCRAVPRMRRSSACIITAARSARTTSQLLGPHASALAAGSRGAW